MIAIKVDVRGIREIQRSLARLPEELRGQAMAAALNKTADKGRAEVNRAIRAEFAISPEQVRNSLEVRRAGRAADRLQATISIFGSPSKRGRSAKVVRFLSGGRGRNVVAVVQRGRRLLTYEFKRGGGLKLIPGSFVGNLGRTVFRRVGEKRLPIEPVQVIGVSQMFTTERIRRRVMAKIERELGIEVDRAVKMVLTKAGLA